MVKICKIEGCKTPAQEHRNICRMHRQRVQTAWIRKKRAESKLAEEKPYMNDPRDIFDVAKELYVALKKLQHGVVDSMDGATQALKMYQDYWRRDDATGKGI